MCVFRHIVHLKLVQNRSVAKQPLLEPRFEDNFNPESRGTRGDARNVQRLRRNLRKETRGAMKKLRTDAVFLAQSQFTRDAGVRRDRIRKTKRILGSLQMQESDYKKRKQKKF